MQPMTEERLTAAARRAVRRRALDAVILFGSQARGEADAHSDWDVCLVGPDEDRARGALAKVLEGERADVLWTDARAPVHEGTVWATIVREGRVLAGNGRKLMRKTVHDVPEREVRRQMYRAHTASLDGRRAEVWIRDDPDSRTRLIEHSESAAKALAMVCCALVGARHSGSHEVARDARAIREHAGGRRGREAVLLRTMADMVHAMDHGTREAHRAGYIDILAINPEAAAQASVRLEACFGTAAALTAGLGWGERELAGLAEHPQARRYRNALLETACAAHRITQKLDAETLEGVRSPGAGQSLRWDAFNHKAAREMTGKAAVANADPAST